MNRFLWIQGRAIPVIALMFTLIPSAKAEVAGKPSEKESLGVQGSFPTELREMISWLPSDSETLCVGKDLQFPDKDIFENEDDLHFSETIRVMCLGLPILTEISGLKDLIGKKLAYAVFAARKFRSPTGFGLSHYEGANLLLFENDALGDWEELIAEIARAASEEVKSGDVRFFKFQIKVMEDLLSFWVCSPKLHTLVIATDQLYFYETMNRIHHRYTVQAFPNDLPEWKHVNLASPTWGIRHYPRIGFELDLSSPFHNEDDGEITDAGAVGYTVSIQSDGKIETTYLSSNPTSVDKRVDLFSEHLPVKRQAVKIGKTTKDLTELRILYDEPMEFGDMETAMFRILWSLGFAIHV